MIKLKQNKSHHFYIECKNDKCRHNAMVPVTDLLNMYSEEITSDKVLKKSQLHPLCISRQQPNASGLRWEKFFGADRKCCKQR